MKILAGFYGALLAIYLCSGFLARLFNTMRCRSEDGYLSEDEDPEDAKMREKIERYQRNKLLREKQRQAIGRSKSNQVKPSNYFEQAGSDTEAPDSKDKIAEQGDYKMPEGRYRDDFFEEINIQSLINYYERNDQEMKLSPPDKVFADKTCPMNKETYKKQFYLILKKKKKTLKRKLDKYLTNPLL